jgi:hypothetical protein
MLYDGCDVYDTKINSIEENPSQKSIQHQKIDNLPQNTDIESMILNV